MEPMDKQRQLKALMKKHSLTRADVAEATGRSLNTVNAWFKGTSAKSHRPCPDDVLNALKKRYPVD
jgi:transcriptional regulator with XRE-family HTH domain